MGHYPQDCKLFQIIKQTDITQEQVSDIEDIILALDLIISLILELLLRIIS
jgi:hypothetical protein